VKQVHTIGVYGWTQGSFLAALAEAGVTRVVDVRRRRGVRGSDYAWANAKRLESALASAGLAYEHRLDLAPTTELRQLQSEADEREGVGKRSRGALAPRFVERYLGEILDRADVTSIADGAALLCVEREPAACHRGLIAERLGTEHGFAVRHLRPRA
jgi:uncharacterized protein (DUF488 family)